MTVRTNINLNIRLHNNIKWVMGNNRNALSWLYLINMKYSGGVMTIHLN